MERVITAMPGRCLTLGVTLGLLGVHAAAEQPERGGTAAERPPAIPGPPGDAGDGPATLADRGLTFELGWTNVLQGVVAGGQRLDWDLGGNIDLAVTADLERLTTAPGSILLRAESRYGETVNDDAGGFTPVNTRGSFPLAGGTNEGIPLTVTELCYVLNVGDTVELTIGKMLTADGDPTEFAGGGGRTQFLNSNFIYNVATSQTAPYSTLGVSVDWTPREWLTVSSSLFATTDSSTTTGFETLDDGWTWWAQAETRYRARGLPGGLTAGFQYGFDGEFDRLSEPPPPGPGEPEFETTASSWAVFLGGWQYVYTKEEGEAEVDAWDDHADLSGLGLFARLGFADPDSNVVRWSASVGLGARGLFPGRDEDTAGVGYYYTDLHDSEAVRSFGLSQSWQGFEAFYSVAITPAARFTLDLQLIDEGVEDQETATVLGARLHLSF